MKERKAQKSKKVERPQILYRLGVIVGVMVVFGVLLGGVVWRANLMAQAYQAEQEGVWQEAQGLLAEMYSDAGGEVPAREIEAAELETVEMRLDEVKTKRYDAEKEQLRQKLGLLEKFIAVRDELDAAFDEGILNAGTTAEKIQEMESKLAELPENYRQVLQGDLENVQQQYQAMGDFETAVRGLFVDAEMKTVAPRITRATYRAVVEQAKNLPQREVAEKYNDALAKVDAVLTQREKEAAEARRNALEAKRRAEELRRQQQKEEAAAWKALNVPYHSQNLQQIYNGCEAASMLMGLQYKGYLKGVDLHKYAEMMPKSDDYNSGFVGSIYDLQPKTYVHWIAPAPLAKFGRESSGNANVVDVSGASLAELDKEVLAGNPVVIYVTFLFNPLKAWLNGAPQNLHVVLLTGYNEKTGAQRVTDPWTQAGGGRTYDLPKAELEKIYNAVGKRAVVIR